MKRPISIILAQAFDRAAHDVALSPQAHRAEGHPDPTRIESLVYWSRGFVAGLTGDYASVPHGNRLAAAFARLRKLVAVKSTSAFSRLKSRFNKVAH